MKTILAAVDGAPSAPTVLRTAALLAGATGARLVLFRAADVPVPEEAQAGSTEEQRFTQRMRDEALRLLEAQQRAAHIAAAELRVEVGPAAPAIEEAARQLGAELIVLAAHGHGELVGGLGRVAAGVLARTERSVLVVRGVTPGEDQPALTH
jgi:nucleotide-binding universal stress UspA family protein